MLGRHEFEALVSLQSPSYLRKQKGKVVKLLLLIEVLVNESLYRLYVYVFGHCLTMSLLYEEFLFELMSVPFVRLFYFAHLCLYYPIMSFI
jgi:hypothetical protein